MADPYIGEIRMFGGSFAPMGWMMCNGQVLSIANYSALFALIGTTYGGDGQTTFALPDLRGRIPLHYGQGTGLTHRNPGESAGAESVTLTSQQIPVHQHSVIVSTTAGDQSAPSGATIWATASTGASMYSDSNRPANVNMNAASLATSGGSQPHDNMMLSLAVTFIIATTGIFPSQT